MKTIKYKVIPTPEQVATFDRITYMLSQVWNACHTVALHNQALKWYRWAQKHGKKQGFDFDGIIQTPLMFSKRSAYMGVSCRRAKMKGRYIKQPGTIEYTYKGKTMHKPVYEWVNDVEPEIIPPMPHRYIVAHGREIDRLLKLINKDVLRDLGVDVIPGTMNYAKALIRRFETVVKGWEDTKRADFHKPRYKDLTDKTQLIQWICNQQPSVKGYIDVKFNHDKNTLSLGSTFIDMPLAGKQLWRIPPDLIPRSWTFTRDVTGYYVSVAYAHPLEAERVTYRARRDTENLERVERELFQAYHSPGNGKTIGIDPGVKRLLTASDGNQSFHIKPRRDSAKRDLTLEVREKRLQSKLDKVKTANNIRYGFEPDKRRSAGFITVDGRTIELKNEQKLSDKLKRLKKYRANRRGAYHHRIAARLVDDGYSSIFFEDTNLKNMTKKSKAKMNVDGGYDKNNAAAKSGLNKSLQNTAIAALRTKIEMKFTGVYRPFTKVAAKNTSQACHCCGELGDRRSQELFVCLNKGCALFEVHQNADDNAAKNILLRGSVAVGSSK